MEQRGEPEQIRALNATGRADQPLRHLSGRDGPGELPQAPLACIRDWTTAGWPKDIMLDANGDWIRGWEVEGKDGELYHCGVLCDRQAPDYARQRIPAELADASLSLPLHRHHHGLALAGMLRARPSDDPDGEQAWKMELLDLSARTANW